MLSTDLQSDKKEKNSFKEKLARLIIRYMEGRHNFQNRKTPKKLQ